MLFAAADVALCVAAAFAGGDLGLYALMATSFFMSIQFPTIFTMSLRGLGVVHEVRVVVPGDGDRRRRVDPARHGRHLRREHHQPRDARACGLFRGRGMVCPEVAPWQALTPGA